jgi:type II secretory pathway component HofQ
VRKALDEPISLEVGDQPLPGVIAQLADLAKVSIVYDRTAMQMIGDGTDPIVTLRAKDMKLRSALRSVTAQNGLSFGVVGDFILVSSEDAVWQRQLRQRINVDLEDVQFTKALRDLAKETATNLVVDPRQAKKAADAKVSLRLDDVPLETAVRLMAEIAGLKPARMGNVLFVTSEERADVLKDADRPPNPAIPGLMGGIGGIGPAAVPGGVAPAVPAAPAPAPPAGKPVKD